MAVTVEAAAERINSLVVWLVRVSQAKATQAELVLDLLPTKQAAAVVEQEPQAVTVLTLQLQE